MVADLAESGELTRELDSLGAASTAPMAT